jgi:hypothetical protein
MLAPMRLRFQPLFFVRHFAPFAALSNGSRLEGDMDVKDRQQNGRKNPPMCELLV